MNISPTSEPPLEVTLDALRRWLLDNEPEIVFPILEDHFTGPEIRFFMAKAEADTWRVRALSAETEAYRLRMLLASERT